MLKRYWIIAVVLGLAVSAGYAQEKTQNLQDGAEKEQQAPKDLPFNVPVKIIEDNESANTRERRETIAHENQNRDIIAQETMAKATQEMNNATKSMMYAAWVSAFLVFVGTALLIWTLRLTRQANQAARDAVEVTREIGEAQVRAYLTMKVNDGRLSDAGEGNFRLAFDISIINTGQSPARNFRILYDIKCVNVLEEIKIPNDGSSMYDAGVYAFQIASKSEFHGHLARTFPMDIDIHRRGETFMKFNYIFDYEDVFGNRIMTPVVSLSIREEPVGSGKISYIPDRIKTVGPNEGQ